MRKIKRYFTIYYVHLQEAFNYRAELLLWSVIDAMPLLGMLVIWLSVFNEGGSIAGYTQATMIAYYVSGYVFQDMTGSHYEEEMIKQIQSGKIVTFLLRPISLKRFLVVHEMAWRTMTFFTAVLPVVLLAVIFVGDLMPAIRPIHLLVLPMMMAIAYLMENVYSLMVMAMGFVFEEAKSLMHVKWMLGWVFGGSMIPFELMPDWLERVALMLPFKYRYYVPVQIYFGNIGGWELLKHLIMEIGWAIVLVLAIKWLWKRNVRKFTAVGS